MCSQTVLIVMITADIVLWIMYANVVEPFPYYRAFLGDEQTQAFVPDQ